MAPISVGMPWLSNVPQSSRVDLPSKASSLLSGSLEPRHRCYLVSLPHAGRCQHGAGCFARVIGFCSPQRMRLAPHTGRSARSPAPAAAHSCTAPAPVSLSNHQAPRQKSIHAAAAASDGVAPPTQASNSSAGLSTSAHHRVFAGLSSFDLTQRANALVPSIIPARTLSISIGVGTGMIKDLSTSINGPELPALRRSVFRRPDDVLSRSNRHAVSPCGRSFLYRPKIF
jgi:hypothetical protein